jgi:PAS domain-containing protein
LGPFIEFVEKIAESIASTISSVKINERTQKLLEESTELTEQMRSQEEEMRQNMEELQATQEEMQRTQKETEAKEHIINSSQLVIEMDPEFKITSANDVVKQLLGFDKSDFSGKPIEAQVVNTDQLDVMKATVEGDKVWSGYITFENSRREPKKFNVSAGKSTDLNTGGHKFLMFCSSLNEN